MPRAPPKKRQRVDDSPQPPAAAMQTRSKAPAARAASPPPASKSKATIELGDTDDDMLGADEDEEAFEYESDIGSAAGEDAEADGDEEEAAGDMDEASVLVLSSDDDSSMQEPPPELPRAKGKLTTRKQFAQDIDNLARRFAGTQDEILTGALASWKC
jgi:hypothetical protein